MIGHVIGAIFCSNYGHQCAEHFEPHGQYGVAVSRVELTAHIARQGFEEGCTILSYDGANTLNSMYRHTFLPQLAVVTPVAVNYATNFYAGKSPKLLLAMQDETTVTKWVADNLTREGITPNRGKFHVLLACDIDVAALPEDQQKLLHETQLTVAEGRMRVLSTPIGTELYQKMFIQEMSSGEPT